MFVAAATTSSNADTIERCPHGRRFFFVWWGDLPRTWFSFTILHQLFWRFFLKPPATPCESAHVVVYLDANMPELEPCRRGCQADANRFCVHRFGPRIWIVSEQSRISLTRLSDLQVILDFLHIIRRRWGKSKRVHRNHYIIVTHDKTFIASAKASHANERNMQHLPLVWGPDHVVCAPSEPTDRYRHKRVLRRAIRIDVASLANGPGDHRYDLKSVLNITRILVHAPLP